MKAVEWYEKSARNGYSVGSATWARSTARGMAGWTRARRRPCSGGRRQRSRETRGSGLRGRRLPARIRREEGERAEAFTWFQKAAEGGAAEMQYLVGKRHLKTDETEAVRFLTMAAEQGQVQSQFLVSCRSIDRSIDRLIDWLIDWSIG